MITIEQIKSRRKALGWTQAELAARAQLGKSTIAQIERDVMPGKGSTMLAIEFVIERGERDRLAELQEQLIEEPY